MSQNRLQLTDGQVETAYKSIRDCDCLLCKLVRENLNKPGALLAFMTGAGNCPLCDLRREVVRRGISFFKKITSKK